MGPRADDMVEKEQMLQDIRVNGYTSLENYDSDVSNKVALNTLDVYFVSAGILTDLITPGYVLKKEMQNKRTNVSVSKQE